jgi:preprotein translocase subunit SecG
MSNIKFILSVVQIALAVLLICAVLLQQRGVGLSATFGGEGNIYRTKRGLEKGLFIATIVLSILFFGAALASFLAAR